MTGTLQDGPRHGASVLLVEDDALIALDVEGMLGQLGLGPKKTVASFEAARRACRHDAYDLMVFDLNLDGVSSLPLIEAQVTAGSRIIVTSGSDVEKEALGRLGVPVVAKPASVAAFKAALSKLAAG